MDILLADFVSTGQIREGGNLGNLGVHRGTGILDGAA